MIGVWDAQASLRLTPGYAYGVRLAVLDHPDCIFFESKTKLARV